MAFAFIQHMTEFNLELEVNSKEAFYCRGIVITLHVLKSMICFYTLFYLFIY
jgi:hypothetical protein